MADSAPQVTYPMNGGGSIASVLRKKKAPPKTTVMRRGSTKMIPSGQAAMNAQLMSQMAQQQ